MNRDIPFMRTALYSRAHTTLHNAVRDGSIVKPGTCERCDVEKRVVAHHEDYSKPLMIEWLCSPCHRQRHLVGSVGHVKELDSSRACETDTMSAVEETVEG